MRKYFLFFISCILFFSLAAQSQGTQKNTAFVVQGHLKDADGKKISLIDVKSNKKLAHTTIKKGVFQMEGQAASSMDIVVLKARGNDFPLLLVVAPGDSLNITGTFADFPIVDVAGNEQSKAMQQYQEEFIPILNKVKALNAKAASFSPGKDSAALAGLQNEAKQLKEEMKNTSLAFVQYHQDAVASLFALLKGVQAFSPQQLKQLYGTLSVDVRKSDFGKMAEQAIQSRLSTAIGVDAPQFTLKDTDGHPVKLSSFKGKYVLVDFWASWCGPCRAENPRVVAAYHKYEDENFTILGVSLDRNKDRWEEAIQQDHLSWTQVSDLKGWNSAAARLYHVTSIPANFLLDPSGKIVAKDLRGDDLARKLHQIFK